jgi:hypothetical protein
MAFEAARARDYYSRAWRGLPAADHRTLFAAEIMGHTYFALLRAIEARRFGRVRRRACGAHAPPPRHRAGGLGRAPASAPGAALLSPAPRARSGEGRRHPVSARMRAQVFHGPGDLRLEELPRPHAGAGRARHQGRCGAHLRAPM